MAVHTKYTATLDSQPLQEVELYSAATTVRGKIGKSVPKVHRLLSVFEDYVNGAIIQYHRIRAHQRLLREILLEAHLSFYDMSVSETGMVYLQLSLLDIHFYTICIDKLDKLYPRIIRGLSELASRAKNVGELREKRNLAKNRLRLALESIAKIRNYLEHLEDEIMSDNLDDMHFKAGETEAQFTIGTQNQQATVDMSSISQVTGAYEALINYIDALPDTG